MQLLKNVLQGSEENITVEFNETNAQFRFGDTTLTCRLVEGKYPNYEAVIPKENPNILEIDRDLLLNSVRRVSIFSNKTTHQIRLKIAGSALQISAEDYDFSNKAEERLSAIIEGMTSRLDSIRVFLSRCSIISKRKAFNWPCHYPIEQVYLRPWTTSKKEKI